MFASLLAVLLFVGSGTAHVDGGGGSPQATTVQLDGDGWVHSTWQPRRDGFISRRGAARPPKQPQGAAGIDL